MRDLAENIFNVLVGGEEDPIKLLKQQNEELQNETESLESDVSGPSQEVFITIVLRFRKQ